MNYETFDEVFTYIGKAPKQTPEEIEEEERESREMDEEVRLQIWRMQNGLDWDGTKQKTEKEKEEYEKRLYEAYLKIPKE